MFDSNDDYDFTPSSSSRLASLFDNPPNLGDDNTLVYTAPKQPKPKKELDLEENSKNAQQNSVAVIVASAVTLWKVQESNQKVLLGKHGLAVIGSTTQNQYEIIVYKERNNILLRSKLNDLFKWHMYPDSFGVFYSNGQCFMVKFNNKNEESSFIEKLQTYCYIDKSKILQQKEEKEEITKKEELESDSSESARASILQRIKNMGQQLLPRDVVTNASTDLSDSEADDSQIKKVPPRKLKRNPQNPSEIVSSSSENSQTNTVLVSPTYFQNPPHHSIPSFGNPVLYQAQPQYDITSFLMMQNAELKANLLSISNKLDNISSSSSNVDDRKTQSKTKALELRLENLTSELEKYQHNYEELKRKYEKTNTKGNENDNIVKEKDLLISEQRKEILKLQANLEESNKQIKSLESLPQEIDILKNEIIFVERQMEEKNLEIRELQQKEDLSPKIEELNNTISSLTSEIENYKSKLIKLQLEKSESSNKQKENLTHFADSIKNNMNEMYQDFMSNFGENNSYSMQDIHANIAKNLKYTTYKIIENSKDIFK